MEIESGPAAIGRQPGNMQYACRQLLNGCSSIVAGKPGEAVPDEPAGGLNQSGREIDFGDPGTILLVDDEPVVIGLLAMMLTKLGFTVLSARDGLEAIDVFCEQQEDIRLVMTDVYMPRMNGWDTLAAVRQVAPDMPVVLFSGCSEEQVMKEPHSEVPQAFLKKPFGFELLRDTIQRIMIDTM